VEHALLHELLERREILGAFSPRETPRSNPLSKPVRYIRCPVCSELMNRKNFGQQSGIVVDVCARHGTWFERGELPHVFGFVESGGLARARRRADEERERVARVRRELAASRPPQVGTLGAGLASEASLLDDLADAGLALAACVRDLIHR
jgi:Zn-finger nucleic acid-binding protein